TEIREYELSRRKLLSAPSGGGFVELNENSPSFTSASGNDYAFATSFPLGNVPANPPLMVKLPSRCADCHGTDQTFLMSFAVHESPVGGIDVTPRVRILNVQHDEHAVYVIQSKMARDDFQSLRADAGWGTQH